MLWKCSSLHDRVDPSISSFKSLHLNQTRKFYISAQWLTVQNQRHHQGEVELQATRRQKKVLPAAPLQRWYSHEGPRCGLHRQGTQRPPGRGLWGERSHTRGFYGGPLRNVGTFQSSPLLCKCCGWRVWKPSESWEERKFTGSSLTS